MRRMETMGTRTAVTAAVEGMDTGKNTRRMPLEIIVERIVSGVMAGLQTTIFLCPQTTMSQVLCASVDTKERPMGRLRAEAQKDQLLFMMDEDGADHGTARA